MKRISFLSTLLSLTAMLLLSLSVATQIPAQTPATDFTGRARGIVADVVYLQAPQANVTVSDTGQLPIYGGSITSTPVAANVNILGGNVILHATAVNTMTSGGVPAGTNTSQSQASVTHLMANIGRLYTFNADLVRSNSMCQCTNFMPSCTGSTMLTNLVIRGQAIPVSPAPNTQIPLFIFGTTPVGTVFLNEQVVTGTGQKRMIRVNAVRISLFRLFPALAGTNIIIAQSQSDITCAAGLTASTVSVPGRVLNSSGRGIYGAVVTMTDSNGEIRSTRTNPRGRYRFDEVMVGRTYVIAVTSKLQTFTSQIVTVNDELTDFDFTANE